jgi:hypothetical protein
MEIPSAATITSEEKHWQQINEESRRPGFSSFQQNFNRTLIGSRVRPER